MLFSPIKHVAKIEVRYAETDAMGVVHHSVYPIWFEQARTEIMRIHEHPYHLLEAEGFSCPLIQMELEYKRSCHYGEFADVHVSLAKEDRLRTRFFYEIFVEGELCVKGSTLHIFLKDGKPSRHAPESFEKKFFPKEP